MEIYRKRNGSTYSGSCIERHTETKEPTQSPVEMEKALI